VLQNRKNNIFYVDMLHGSILRALLLFSIPVFFSAIFQQLYNTADTVIVGHILGEEALAAMGASGVIYELLVGFALGVGSGLSIVAARCFGAGDQRLLRRCVAASVVISVVIALVIALGGAIGLPFFLRLLNTPEEIMAGALAYCRPILLCTLVPVAYNLCAAMLRAIGNSLMPLIFLIISSLLNILLDLFCILYLDMGIAGAAVATVIAQAISVVLCLIYITHRVKILLPQKGDWSFSRTLYGELLAQGLSQGLMGCIVSAGTAILQSGINRLGYLIIAGHTAVRKIFALFSMLFVGMYTATMTFVSQNKGALPQDPSLQGDGIRRIRTGVLYGYLYGLVCTVILSVIVMPLAPQLVQLLSGSEHQVVLENGAMYLRVVAPCHCVLSVLCITRNSLQAIGQKLLPVLSSVIELVGKVLFIWLFIPRFGYAAVIVCEPIIWVFMTVELVIAFWRAPLIRMGTK